MTTLTEVLKNETHDWNTRLAHLAGWRDAESSQAVASGIIPRLAPAVCGVGSAIGVALQSPMILAVFALTAAVGMVAPNHPVEMIANSVAMRMGRTPMPAARAGRRLGCAMGVVFLGGAAIAYAVGAIGVGTALALPLAIVAGFVAVTNVCVPSIILTLLAGSEACTRPALLPSRSH